jgi:hypothetical protein
MTTTPTNTLNSLAILHCAASISRDPALLIAIGHATRLAADIALRLSLLDARKGLLGSGTPEEAALTRAILTAPGPSRETLDEVVRLLTSAAVASGDRDIVICADSACKCLRSLHSGAEWLGSGKSSAEYRARNALRRANGIPTAPRMPYGASPSQVERARALSAQQEEDQHAPPGS